MASNEAMSESRVQSLKALLPMIRTKLAFAIKCFQNHLAWGTKYGFLTDDEMFEVFSGHNAVKHVDVLFAILTGKDNAAFDRFCSILEEHGYGHWSAELQRKMMVNTLRKLGDETLREFFYLKKHELSVGEVIRNGEGKFSKIREATWYGRPCAVKIFKINPKDEKEMKRVEREACTWAAFLRHPNIVQFYGLLEGSSPEGLPSVVMELLTANLQDFLENCRSLRDSIPLDFKRAILLDVCGAMAFLHNQNIMHGDLKGRHILLTASLVAKVSDFTTAQVYDTIDKLQLSRNLGDPNYAAPEMEDENYDLKVDVYSFGSVAVLTLTHREPVPRGRNTWSGYERREYLLADLPEETQKEFQPLLKECFDVPDQRPSFSDIQKNLSSKPVLKDVDRYEIMKSELDNLHTQRNEYKRKKEDGNLIEQVKGELREQQVTMKEILAHLKVPSLAGVPQLDPGDKDEALDKEKLLSRVEDLQKQLKEKEEELARLKEEEKKLRAAEEEKTSLSTRLTKAEESLEDTKARLKEEEEKLRAAEAVKTSLNTRLMETEDSLEDTKVQLKEKEEKLKASEDEKISLSTRLMEAEESLEDTKNENISLKFKQVEKGTELMQVKQQLAEVRQQLVIAVQNKRKEEDQCLIEKALEGMREQQMVVMKDILSHLNVPSLAGVPHLDSGDKDEDLDKEKLLGQVEDLQKQLKEKEEELNKTSSKLTEISQERDSIEGELKDAFSIQEETVKKLDEFARQKSLSEDLSQKLAQSKECIKALENMLTNLVLWEKPTEEGVEQISSGIHSADAIETVVPGPLAHETELKKFCWIPFGIQTLTVGQEGGLFPLQPQSKELSEDRDVIMLEVPESAVNTAVCDELCIRYGVIVYGPFDVPEGYQLGSMAVYIYFEEDHAVKSVLLHLPHWSGKDGESSLKCAIAPHRLEAGEEKYKFRLTEDGDFHSTEGSGVIAIDGHCTLYALIRKALKEESNLQYYATRVEKVGRYGTTLDVVITHASQVWLEILKKDKSRGTVYPAVLFTFSEHPLQGKMSSDQGSGWEAWLGEHDEVKIEDIDHKSHGIEDANDMKGAVKKRVYPPFISCETTYSEEVQRTGEPTKVYLVIKGAKDKVMNFPCTAYKYKSAERQGPIGESTSFSTQSSVQSTSTGHTFSSKHFMDKYKEPFLEYAQAKEIASRLELSQTCPLPSRVCSRIRQAISEEDAAQELFKHFRKEGTPDTIRSLCVVMTELIGYPKMNQLGDRMKSDEDLTLPYEAI